MFLNLFSSLKVKIEPLNEYFPSFDILNKAQQKTYIKVKEILDENKYIDIEGNISYIFLYVYEFLEKIHKLSQISTAINKLEIIKKIYSSNFKIYNTLDIWVADFYALLGDYASALIIYEKHLSIKNTSTHLANTVLNLKYKLKLDVKAKDLLCINKKFTKFISDKYENIEDYCDLVLKREKQYLGMDYLQYIFHKYSNEPKYEMPLFSGLPCGYDLIHLKPSQEKIIALYAIKEVYTYCEQLSRDAENLLREKMEIPKVGEGWVKETELYYRVKEFLSPEEVVHHYRASWLGKQHLDIFIPKLNLAFEYQGLQHYQPIDFFGGEKAFKENVKRDKLKQKKCLQQGVHLYHINPDYSFLEIKEIIAKHS